MTVRKPIAIGPLAVVRVHNAPNAARLARVSSILLDIVDHAGRVNPLDVEITPGKDDRP